MEIGKFRLTESHAGGGGASPDDDRRFLNKGGLDAVSMPELVDLLAAKSPEEVRRATRDFVTTIVETDAKTFGVEYKFESQTFLKVLEGQRRSAMRDGKADLAGEFDRCSSEISAISQILFWANTFNAVGKSMGELGSRFDTMSSGTMITPDTYRTFFRLPSEKMTANTDLGLRIDKVIRACIVVGMCEDPAKIKEMKKKPGWKLLFETDEKEKEFLGNVEEWDDVRVVKTDPDTKLVTYDSLTKERKSGHRVGIAKNGNSWARPETTRHEAELKKAILELVDGDVLAYHLGKNIFKIWGLDAEHAAMTVLKDEKETVIFEGYPNATDLGKLFHFSLWQKKQNAAGHPCGPKETRGNIKSLLTSFPKYVVIQEEDGSNKHTLYEEMWGYGNTEPERLGNASWDDVITDDMNNWGSRINVPAGGEKGNGLFGWLKAEKGDAESLTSIQFWELLTLNLNVVVNEQLISGGELFEKDSKELSDMVKKEKQAIVKNFWYGVKSLPDYPVWSTKVDILDADKVAAHIPKTKAWQIKHVIWPAVGIDYLST